MKERVTVYSSQCEIVALRRGGLVTLDSICMCWEKQSKDMNTCVRKEFTYKIKCTSTVENAGIVEGDKIDAQERAHRSNKVRAARDQITYNKTGLVCCDKTWNTRSQPNAQSHCRGRIVYECENYQMQRSRLLIKNQTKNIMLTGRTNALW